MAITEKRTYLICITPFPFSSMYSEKSVQYFFHKYKSRNCQKTRSIHSCRKLVKPHTASSPRCAGHKPRATVSHCAASPPCHRLPWPFRSPTSLPAFQCRPPNSAWRAYSVPQASRAGLSSPPTLRTVFAAVATQLSFQPPAAPLRLNEDGGWRDTEVSKGNGQSVLMSYIFAV